MATAAKAATAVTGPPPHPEPFLTAHIHREAPSPGVTGVCIGYESNEFRTGALARHAMEWLPEFCLTPSERENIGHHNSVAQMRRAADTVYKTDKFSGRGEFGELFLHIATRQFLGSSPAVSKIYYKSSVNDTVKGFDAVQVIENSQKLELVLGEAKLYKDFDSAAQSLVSDLKDHFAEEYLRGEFLLISGKLDSSTPFYEPLKRLLSPNTSLDQVFSKIRVPALIAYHCDALGADSKCDSTHVVRFVKEIEARVGELQSLGLPPIEVHLFLMPLRDKVRLVKDMDQELKKWQKI